MTLDAGQPSVSRWSQARSLAQSLGMVALVSAIVSGVISGLVGYQFASRLEANKEKLASIVRYKDQIDSSQNSIISQLGIYTDRLFRDKASAKLEDLQKEIITAQLQLNRIRDQVRVEDQQLLTDYETELGSLLKNLRNVSGPNDLGPVLASAQKTLIIHDKFSERVRENIKAVF